VKKVLIGLVAVVVGIVAALLIAPSFIDWNQYKGEITAQAKAFTGRALAIDGDLKATILPAPAVVVEGIRLANAEGAGTADMVRLKSVEVRVALGPLLGGRVQVETVKLVDPVIHIEKLADGRWNFDFATEEEAAPRTAAPEGASADSPVALQLDRLLIENGVFVYRDAAAGVEERIDGLDARFAVASLEGTVRSRRDADGAGHSADVRHCRRQGHRMADDAVQGVGLHRARCCAGGGGRHAEWPGR